MSNLSNAIDSSNPTVESITVAPSFNKPSTAEIVGVGGSGGTMLALLANNLPSNEPSKSWLVILAPGFSFALSWTWQFARKSGSNWYGKHKLKKAVSDLEKAHQKALSDLHSSLSYKQEVHRELEKARLELALYERSQNK